MSRRTGPPACACPAAGTQSAGADRAALREPTRSGRPRPARSIRARPAFERVGWAGRTDHPEWGCALDGGQCTSNFILADGGGTYIGQAAHCSGTGGSTATDGCESGSLSLGTEVEIDGASRPGTLVYSSWLAMQRAGETAPDACAYNDFALVKIDPVDVGKANPSIPGFGGPNGIGGDSATGDTVFSYGNSSLRGGVTLLSPKQGNVGGDRGRRREPYRLHRHAGHPR